MNQDILALATVFVAIGYLIWSIYRIFTASKNNNNTLCGGCSSGACSTKQLRGTIDRKK